MRRVAAPRKVPVPSAVMLSAMAKVAITGRFATTSDVVRVHEISPARQAWLEEQLLRIEKRATPARKLSGSKNRGTVRKFSRTATSSAATRSPRAAVSKSRASSKRKAARKSTSAKKR